MEIGISGDVTLKSLNKSFNLQVENKAQEARALVINHSSRVYLLSRMYTVLPSYKGRYMGDTYAMPQRSYRGGKGEGALDLTIIIHDM